jgi:hypothetical protein
MSTVGGGIIGGSIIGAGINAGGSGDMRKAVYDPTNKNTDIFAYTDDAILDLKDGVNVAGDTLFKLYSLIISSFSETIVADIAERDALDIAIGNHVFVLDDGDGNWALYKSITAGVGATFLKLSDPDLLNAVMDASAIKISYESNADTNAFTDALLTKLNGIAEAATANDTDANLLDRANHTGTQAISTVSSLQTELNARLKVVYITYNAFTNLFYAGTLASNTEYIISGTSVGPLRGKTSSSGGNAFINTLFYSELQGIYGNYDVPYDTFYPLARIFNVATFTSSANYDTDAGFLVNDVIRITGTNHSFLCTDNTSDNAVWVLQNPANNLQDVTASGAETTNRILIGDINSKYNQYQEDAINHISNGNSTLLKFTIPTNANTINVPDASGTLALLSDINSGGSITHATASGTDTYSITVTGVTAHADGDTYLVTFTNANTTASVLQINGLGGVALYRSNFTPLLGGEILRYSKMLCVYNATFNIFQCIGASNNNLFAFVTNADSVAITKGQVVYAFGGQGDRMSVKLASNSSESTSSKTVGVVMTNSIAANGKGIIVIAGLLDGLSTLPTSTYADGDSLYLGNTAGTITNIKPSNPDKVVWLGKVTNASNSNAGKWYVRVQNEQDLSNLIVKNAAITGATKTKITYDAIGLVTNGADATTADIADSTNKRYVTDANLTTIGNQSGTNTGDETTSTIKTKLGITTLSGSNTGDQDLSTLMVKANNLSDLTNTSTARTNLKIQDIYITGGDQTNASPTTTASSITGLSWAAAANKRYKVSGIIHVGTAVGGIKIQITIPTGATMFIMGVSIRDTNGQLIQQVAHTVSATPSAAVFCPFSTSSGYIKVDGEVQLSSTAGTVQFGYASGTLGQTSTIFQLGTQLTITEL